jgi:hypothetical protein
MVFVTLMINELKVVLVGVVCVAVVKVMLL